MQAIECHLTLAMDTCYGHFGVMLLNNPVVLNTYAYAKHVCKNVELRMRMNLGSRVANFENKKCVPPIKLTKSSLYIYG